MDFQAFKWHYMLQSVFLVFNVYQESIIHIEQTRIFHRQFIFVTDCGDDFRAHAYADIK